MDIITLPPRIGKTEKLVTITRREYDELCMLKKFLSHSTPRKVKEADILHWSHEAKKLKAKKKLPVLQSLKSMRN